MLVVSQPGACGFLLHLLDGVDGEVLVGPVEVVFEGPVPVGCCCEVVSVEGGATLTHWPEAGSYCSGAWHSGACVDVVAFVGVGVGVGLGVGTYTDWQFASEPVGVPGRFEPEARVPGSTDWPGLTRLEMPEQVGA